MNEPIHIISLGAGVQSSTMALMAAAGEITPMPKCAIFADTQAEPKSVYTWLDWLEKQLPFPVRRVTGGNLSEISTSPRTSKKTGLKYLPHAIPAYVLNTDGTGGSLLRQCTDKHKLTPIRRAVDSERRGRDAIVWIGISTDEILRMKESIRRGTIHRWPLIELKMSRYGCKEWMLKHGYPAPPRSACSFCPYHSDSEWRRLRENEPDAFASSIAYEISLQKAFKQATRLTGIPFLHRSLKPLSEVDFSTEEERGQLNMFNNECEGMCGV